MGIPCDETLTAVIALGKEEGATVAACPEVTPYREGTARDGVPMSPERSELRSRWGEVSPCWWDRPSRDEEMCYTIRSCKMVAKWKGKGDGFADHTGFT